MVQIFKLGRRRTLSMLILNMMPRISCRIHDQSDFLNTNHVAEVAMEAASSRNCLSSSWRMQR